MFGSPQLDVDVQEGKLARIEVGRGAPCGATWYAAQKVLGMPVEEGIIRYGLEVQFFCSANPAGWDPIWGKSPVHLAADIHSNVLKVGVKKSAKV